MTWMHAPIRLHRPVRKLRRVDQLGDVKPTRARAATTTPTAAESAQSAETEVLLAAVLAQLQSVSLGNQQLVAEVKQVVVEIAAAIAERVVRAAVEEERQAIERLVEELCERHAGGAAEIRLNPADLDLLKRRVDQAWFEAMSDEDVSVVADARVERGNGHFTSGVEGFVNGLSAELPALKQAALRHVEASTESHV